MSRRNSFESEAEDFSPLHLAVKNDCIESLEMLLKGGFNIRARNIDGFSALHLAVHLRRRKAADFLLLACTDGNPTDAWGFSHLHGAAILDKWDCIEDLVKLGFNINQRVVEEMSHDAQAMEACRQYHKEHSWPVRLHRCWSSFVEVHPSQFDYWPGYTALHFAVENRCFTSMEKLLKYGADPNIKNDAGHTPLHLACALPSHICREYIRELLMQKADINGRTNTGETPLHVAVENWNAHAVMILIHCKIAKADVGAVNYNGQTCLHIIAEKMSTKLGKISEVLNMEKETIIRELLRAGCPIDAPQMLGNLTALEIARENKLTRLVEVLSSAVKEKEEASIDRELLAEEMKNLVVSNDTEKEKIRK